MEKIDTIWLVSCVRAAEGYLCAGKRTLPIGLVPQGAGLR